MPNNSDQLTVSGLACVRGDVTLFEALDFSVAAGEVLQIQGANGSGKTSLLRLLCGLSPPAAGKICWNGVDIATQADEFRAAVSYIGHRRGVSEDLSPLENLEFACALDHPAESHACRDALTSLGLERRLHTPARLLSAGQVQRTALARLLLSTAQLWLLDEPFTALDSDGRAQIEQLLEHHAGRGGLSVVATHQPMHLEAGRVRTLRIDEF
ncbi:MAG: cytochrome c biogenesis heme-transporting ATPase CcmA [Gammaproteobacteria bacterium]